MQFRRLPLLGTLLVTTSLLAVAVAWAASDFQALRGSLTASDDTLGDDDQGDGKVVREGPVDTTDPTVGPGDVPRTRVAKDGDPYAALGYRYGGFILFPALTLTGGYTTNATAAAGGRAAGFFAVEPELTIQSDWDRHAATLVAKGSYESFTDNAAAARPDASIDATGRIDLPDEWTADLAAGYHFSHQDVSDPNFPAGVDTPPGVHDLTSSAALNGRFGDTVFTLAGSLERTLFDNGLASGVVVDQGDRNNDLYGVRARVGYELTPQITPFVEGELTRRGYDRIFDDSGLRRSSRGTAFRVGLAYDSDPVLKGEFAVGLRQEIFDDPALKGIRAVTFDGSIDWSPTELTTVTFDLSTGINPSTDPASSGSVAYDGSVDLAYAYRRNLTIDWKAALTQERFQGTGELDDTYRLGLGTTWKINRDLQLTSGYSHEWLRSTDVSSNYQSDELRFELRVQR